MKLIGLVLCSMMYIPIPFSKSKHLLRNFWEKRLNVSCTNIQWTCEHVVPKSLIHEHNDLHNLILLPSRLNNARSNYPYIHDDTCKNNTIFKIINPCFHAQCDCDLTGKLISKKLFIPPDLWKGMIGRSVLYMNKKYPHHHELLHKKVLDRKVASLWNDMFPATQNEMDWNKIVSSIQGDENPYLHHR